MPLSLPRPPALPIQLPLPQRVAAAKDGYFPPGTVTHRVQRERLVGLLYGHRAILIGGTHPVAFTGTHLHTRHLDHPFSRLAETAIMFEDVLLGSKTEADRALRITHAQHKRVKGTLPEQAGYAPAGTPYSAYDHDLMLWTWAVLYDSAEVIYDTFVRRLSAQEKRELYDGWVRWAELFGMPRNAAPATYADFRAYWHEQMHSAERVLTDAARVTAHTIVFEAGLPLHMRPAQPLITLLVKGTTPAPIREAYGLSWTPADEVAFRAATAALKMGKPFVPSPVRYGRVGPIFSYLSGWERRQVARGRVSIPQLGDLRYPPGHQRLAS